MGRNQTTPDGTDALAASLTEPLLLCPDAVAGLLGVTRAQVYTLMRSGQLTAVKIGRRGQWRISRRALDEFVSALEEQADERARRFRSRAEIRRRGHDG